ncbi:hypothetical protein CesoFtcFv8_025089 [Champsocephalus esox]|uniref:Uncharacterized protein n=1 Tax=Champsocephalus esox TaxID=159716 RepID=A0AAN8GGF3_9TELE|nr:hypothetical protein CesoFtcFv8_025089 [Champsocephalus esox]
MEVPEQTVGRCLLFGLSLSPYYLMFGRRRDDKVRSVVEREGLFEGLKRQEAVFNELDLSEHEVAAGAHWTPIVTVLAPIRGRGRAVKPMQRFNKIAGLHDHHPSRIQLHAVCSFASSLSCWLLIHQELWQNPAVWGFCAEDFEAEQTLTEGVCRPNQNTCAVVETAL